MQIQLRSGRSWETTSALLLVSTVAISGCGGGHDSPSANAAVKTPAAMCSALAGMTVPAASIGLPTTGATVVSATLVADTDSGNTNGEYCKVLGSIHPVEFNAPDIRAEVDLPTNFNGKSVHFGGGGFDGAIPDTEGSPLDGFLVGAEPAGVTTPLRRGYVTLGSDSGHEGTSFDGQFAENDEALANYAGDHIKKTHDFAAYIAKTRYGSAFVHSYFIGGSGGGRQGLIAAQRFPQDYDGIISTFPASGITGLWLQMGRISRSLLAPGGYVTPAKGKALLAAVMEQCDALDGVADGIVSNPSACVFDPKQIRCPGGVDTGDTCLSDAQINTMSTAGTPLTFSFDLANGIQTFPPYNVFAGADFWSNSLAWGASATDATIEPGVFGKSAFYYTFSNDMLRFAVARDPGLSILNFDPTSPGPLAARIQAVSALMDSTSTDLTQFQSRGGKIILQHGQSDQFIPAQLSIDYYNRLVSRFGQGPLGQFLKFYLVPGAAHGSGGQFGGSYDGLTALDNWVTKGIEPHNLTITDLAPPAAGRTRPMCEYPQWPKYVGGDQNIATSFVCSN
ncbi:pimeloyl-ACP methyl ester carboxylesterase [Paraburkholderia sp. WC7.3g]|uniref:Tannase/feruloyl esterase family alpha/beta hydrolase n=1 Tax=Paraburkholderia podalyriae TaxID=1938811 RepID=A0ABR7PZL6_9BURK|nr:tannase/feruloyl esterase family alpha/beta hydrolase [Paraburkholderia podalyriae]MBC8751656.1 tannase/feruloyl esterase family alpha/beta hydrolase [Paraburkholderia podalyriae]